MRAETDRGDLEYEVHGPGDGMPLLLIAGINQQLSSWPQPFLDHLAGQGLRVIVYDHRDVGLSPPVEADAEPDVLQIIGGDHSSVCTHSMTWPGTRQRCCRRSISIPRTCWGTRWGHHRPTGGDPAPSAASIPDPVRHGPGRRHGGHGP